MNRASPRIFYISSFGGSATEWLSQALSMHPRIVCWHGTRSIPPFPSGTSDLTPEAFAEGLERCAEKAQGQKIFGAVHGFYGVQARPAVEARGGRFSAMVRHPVRRIHSLFWEHVGQRLGDGKMDSAVLYRQAAERLAEAAPHRAGFFGRSARRLRGAFCNTRAPGDEMPSEAIHKRFQWICNGTFRYDRDCLDALDDAQIIVMERAVQEPDYFVASARATINPELEFPADLLDQIFAGGQRNRHSSDALVAAEVFDAWPEQFKETYFRMLERNGGADLIDRYAQLGYRIDDLGGIDEEQTLRARHGR